MEDLAGVGACREERVIAELARVAVSGTLFVFADHLTDRRIDVDNQLDNRRDTGCPPAFGCLTVDRYQLADVTNVNDRKNVPNVDGAITRCPSTPAVDPARNMSA